MNGLVTRVRLEATGSTEQEVSDALAEGARTVKESFGGSWYTDEDRPPVIQMAFKGNWGYLFLKRVVMS